MPLLWAVLGAVLGLVVAIHPVAVWAWGTVIIGVGLLVTNTHFRLSVCFALSLNYWCAVAWIASIASVNFAAVLVVLAIVLRSSLVLFMDFRTYEKVRSTFRVLHVWFHPPCACSAGTVGAN